MSSERLFFERPLVLWVISALTVILIIPIWDCLDIPEKYDYRTAMFVYVNLISYLAFRVFAFSRVEAITGFDMMRSRADELSGQTPGKNLAGKSIGECFSDGNLKLYSKIRVLMELTTEESAHITKQWLIAIFAFILIALISVVAGFGEIFKELTPAKSALLTGTLCTCILHFWVPIIETGVRNRSIQRDE